MRGHTNRVAQDLPGNVKTRIQNPSSDWEKGANQAPKSHAPAFLVDVAGNKGHEILSFALARPTTCKIFISRSTISHQKQIVRVKAVGVYIQPFDFFTTQPVQGPRGCFFGDICHDYPDSKLVSEEGLFQVSNCGFCKADELPAASDFLVMLFLTGMGRPRRS